VYSEYGVQGSEITFKIRYDVLYDICSFTITVHIYNNLLIKFLKHMDEEGKESDTRNLDI
jgi:hypothetical protein